MPSCEPVAGPSGSVPDPKAKAEPKAVLKPLARVAPAGFVSYSSVVRRAAEELTEETGGPARPAPAEANVEGPIPPEPSSSGKRYYLFLAGFHKEAFIACGQAVALGYRVGHDLGCAPKGFCSLENALNAANAKGYNEIRVCFIWVCQHD